MKATLAMEGRSRERHHERQYKNLENISTKQDRLAKLNEGDQGPRSTVIPLIIITESPTLHHITYIPAFGLVVLDSISKVLKGSTPRVLIFPFYFSSG